MLKRTLGVGSLALLAAIAPALAQAQAPGSSTEEAPAASSMQTTVEPGQETAAGAPATGAGASGPDEVVATVNGEEITGADVDFARAALGEAVERVPEGQRDDMVLSLLIDMHLMADAAANEGLDDTEAFTQRMEFQRMQALQESYMQSLIERTVTEEAVAARYEEEASKLPPREQVSASHILVEDEARARELIAELQAGADFAELAAANSKDPGSAEQGGSLGFFAKGQMVPQFEEAAFDLEPGEITEEPVQSQFGYHVIRLDETRTVPVPPLEEVAPQIQQIMVREAYVDEIEELKQAASIERSDAAAAAPAGASPADASGTPQPDAAATPAQ